MGLQVCPKRCIPPQAELTVRTLFKLIRHWRLGGFVFCSPGSGAPRPLGLLSKCSNTELLYFVSNQLF